MDCCLSCFASSIGFLVIIYHTICFITRRVARALSPPRSLKGHGSWAVVTGATDGIGLEISRLLFRKGLNVALVGRNEEKLKAVAEEFGGGKDSVKCITWDFLKNQNYEDLASELRELDIGILVNNVGKSYDGAQYLEEIDCNTVDALIDVNLRSTMHLTRLVLPGMKERGRGLIVCVGSGASALPSEPLYCAYAGVKGGIEAFCRSLQPEVSSMGIIVRCHVPLLVATKLSKIRNASYTVPSAADFAASAIRDMEVASSEDCPTVSPFLVHRLMLLCLNALPLPIWNSLRLKQTTDLRRRFLAKKSGDGAK